MKLLLLIGKCWNVLVFFDELNSSSWLVHLRVFIEDTGVLGKRGKGDCGANLFHSLDPELVHGVVGAQPPLQRIPDDPVVCIRESSGGLHHSDVVVADMSHLADYVPCLHLDRSGLVEVLFHVLEEIQVG